MLIEVLSCELETSTSGLGGDYCSEETPTGEACSSFDLAVSLRSMGIFARPKDQN
jgi:hypothetical protein